MMNKLPELKNITYIPLYQLCTDIIDCPHSTPEWLNQGVRVIRNFNLEEGYLNFSKGSFVSEQTFIERTVRALPQEGDIIISREAPVGTVALVPAGLKCCLGQRLVLIRPDSTKINSHYLLNALMSDFVIQQYQKIEATGSTVSNLTIPELEQLLIPVSDYQQEIGELFSMFQSKIILNNTMDEMLIKFVVDTYMHFFFRKKANGTINNLLLENPKSTIKVSQAKNSNGNYPFFTSGEAILKWNDSLASGRNILLNTGGNADVKFYSGDLAYSTDTWCIYARNNLTDYLYLFLFTHLEELNVKFFQGTGLKHLQKELLKKREIYIPTDDEAIKFNNLVVPALSLRSNNIANSQTILNLRSNLRSAFMNGQAYI